MQREQHRAVFKKHSSKVMFIKTYFRKKTGNKLPLTQKGVFGSYGYL